MSSSSSDSPTGMSTPSVAGEVCAEPSPLAAEGEARGAGMRPGAACSGVPTACAAPLLPLVGRMLPCCSPYSVELKCCRSAQMAAGLARWSA
eukprot:13926112-Heterocapsa_arctica.AAC.1